MSDFDFFRRNKTIKTDAGIKARSKRGKFVKNWWASRWIETLEGLIDPGRLRRGQNYARRGQVLSIEETKNGIEARVQGSRPAPYKVKIRLSKLSKQQWEQVLDTLADQAIFSAQLLAGEMPQEIETVFEAAGASLFPASAEELQTECSCPDPAIPCKHVAAVHHLLGEQFDEEPFLLFRLRGRSQEQVLQALRQRRAATAETVADSPAEPAEAILPLADSLAHFWDSGQPLAGLKTTIKPPAASLPILKRLGQPSFLSGDIFDLLGPAYEAISDTAITMAFKDEEEENGG